MHIQSSLCVKEVVAVCVFVSVCMCVCKFVSVSVCLSVRIVQLIDGKQVTDGMHTQGIVCACACVYMCVLERVCACV